MLEHSIYSVISPEGCASILWKDAEKMREAAEALRLTAQDLLALGVIDTRRPRAPGGAQRDKPETIARVGAAIAELLAELDGKKPDGAAQGPPAQVPRHGHEVAGRLNPGRIRAGSPPRRSCSLHRRKHPGTGSFPRRPP